MATKQDIPVHDVTRFEVRLRKKMSISGLKTIGNPFATIKVAENPSVLKGDWAFSLFLAACEGTTTQNALKILPKKTKKDYVARLEKAKAKWWKPDKIWSQFPPLVDALLNPPKAPYPLDLLDQLHPVG